MVIDWELTNGLDKNILGVVAKDLSYICQL